MKKLILLPLLLILLSCEKKKNDPEPQTQTQSTTTGGNPQTQYTVVVSFTPATQYHYVSINWKYDYAVFAQDSFYKNKGTFSYTNTTTSDSICVSWISTQYDNMNGLVYPSDLVVKVNNIVKQSYIQDGGGDNRYIKIN